MESEQPYYREPTEGALGPPPAGAGVAAKQSFAAKTVGLVEAHPSMALALIVVLAVLVAALYAARQGWFGLGGGKRRGRLTGRPPPRGKRREARGDSASEDEDDETERLIDSINQSARPARPASR